ncbi:CPZIP protein, partial [Atractosteus spatula]|nr:CPZIP protein [Atractosteus spatula]
MEDRSVSAMEAVEDKLVKTSVAELAGKFKGQVLPPPAGIQGTKPGRRRPPCSLPLHGNNLSLKKEPGHGEEEKAHPAKVKPKNSPLIEKLQANLALSPTALLPSPKSPGIKLQASPFTSPPSTPHSPTVRSRSSEDEVPVSFEKPVEGTVLPSISKGRVRVSIKRRPPTRQHRKSTSEEPTGKTPQESPQQNGEDDVFEVAKEPKDVPPKDTVGQIKTPEEGMEQDGSTAKDTQDKVDPEVKDALDKAQVICDAAQEAPDTKKASETVKGSGQDSAVETQAAEGAPEGLSEANPEQGSLSHSDNKVKGEEETQAQAKEEERQKDTGDEKETPKGTGE